MNPTMRIQGLIRRLEQLKKKHGNVDVFAWNEGEYKEPKPRYDRVIVAQEGNIELPSIPMDWIVL